jgi:predicted transposase YdaD
VEALARVAWTQALQEVGRSVLLLRRILHAWLPSVAVVVAASAEAMHSSTYKFHISIHQQIHNIIATFIHILLEAGHEDLSPYRYRFLLQIDTYSFCHVFRLVNN